LLQTLIILAASTALGAVAGGVIGFFFGGAGAAPGVVLGGELGLEIGTAVLSWLGLAFLAKAILRGFGELWGVLSMGVTRAWTAPAGPEHEYPHQIELAAQDLADAVGILMLLILEAIVTWVFTRAAIGSTKGVIDTAGSNRLASAEAANEAVAALARELRASRLGVGFADWVENNWARLRDDPKLRFRSGRPVEPTGSTVSGSTAEAESGAGGGPVGGAASAEARAALQAQLKLRARQLELGTDPARGFIQAEGAGGVHIEQSLGRTIARSNDPAADFIDSGLGPISLKGPIPATGSVEGLAQAAIKDARFNTATNAVFVDLTGLTAQQAAIVKSMVNVGTAGASKSIFFLE